MIPKGTLPGNGDDRSLDHETNVLLSLSVVACIVVHAIYLRKTVMPYLTFLTIYIYLLLFICLFIYLYNFVEGSCNKGNS